MSKITSYTSLTSPQPDVIVPVVDIHDTSMASTGTTKQVTLANLVKGAGSPLTPTAVKTAAYTAAASDYVKADVSAGSFTVTLPNAPANGTVIGVKIVTNAAGDVNALTVACAGSDVINKSGGPVSFTMTSTGQAKELQYNSGIWLALNTDDAFTSVATARQGTWYLDQFTGTDDQKMTAALAAWAAAGGGRVVLSPRAHAFASQWATSWIGTTPATSLIIEGAGAAWNGTLSNPPAGATTVTFTYSGAGTADIDLQHQGSAEIRSIYFTDTVNAGPAFIQTTNAVLDVHHCAFTGVGSGATCAKDAVILGGTGNTPGSGDTARFYGYGSRVHGNFFDSMRRIVTFQAAANSCEVYQNTIDTTCGDSANFGAPFVFAANSVLSCTGNKIHDNLIEAIHYSAIARMVSWATYNVIGPNEVWDNGNVTQLAVMDSTSSGNFVNGLAYNSGQNTEAYPFDPALGTGALSSNGYSLVTQPYQFTNPAVFRYQAQGFSAESYLGGKAQLIASGPQANGWPPAAVIGYQLGTQVTDGGTISGTPYVSSLTAAFATPDTGAYVGSYTNGTFPANTRIAWVWSASSIGNAWAAASVIALGQTCHPATSNGHLYQATTAGTTGSSAPVFPTGGGTVTDGTVVWQDLGAATVAQLTQNVTATITGQTVCFGRTAGGTVGMTQFSNHHIIGSGTAPSYALGAAAQVGTGSPSVTVQGSGHDIGHQVVLTTGASGTLAAGLLCTGTPGQSLNLGAGVIAVTPVNAAAAGLGLYADLRATNTWKISCANAPANSTAYIFNVITLG